MTTAGGKIILRDAGLACSVRKRKAPAGIYRTTIRLTHGDIGRATARSCQIRNGRAGGTSFDEATDRVLFDGYRCVVRPAPAA